MQVGVFPYAVTFKDTLKVDGELKRIHCGNCELAEWQDEDGSTVGWHQVCLKE